MNKWRALELREQAILAFGALFVALFLLWFAVISPVQSTVAAQKARNQAAEASLSRVRQMAVELKQQSAGAGTEQNSGNLTQLVDNSLRQNNLRMSGFQPGSDDSVSMRFDKVPFEQLLQWLYEMEIGRGLVLGELSIRRGSEAGTVAATVRLRKA